MPFKRSWVEAWLGSVTPDEQLVSYVVAATWTGMVVTSVGHGAWFGPRAENLEIRGDARMDDAIAHLDLDPALLVGPGIDVGFYALTDRRLLFGSRSAIRNRPKDLVHAAPIDGARVFWLDHDETAGNRFRHLLVDFGDGRWRRDRSGLTALGKDLRATSNVDEFFAALGDRAIELPSPD